MEFHFGLVPKLLDAFECNLVIPASFHSESIYEFHAWPESCKCTYNTFWLFNLLRSMVLISFHDFQS